MLICHCILTGTTSAVPERGPSAECLLMFCLLFAGQLWSLGGLRDFPDLGAGGHVHVCAVVVRMHLCMCAAPQRAGCRIPQIRRFQPKAWCLAELCVELLCRLMEVSLLLTCLPQPKPLLVPLGIRNRWRLCFPLEGFRVDSEYVRCLGTGLLWAAVQELLRGFVLP